jgi:pimeloyl-ACP methyl ester carboxylesterase
MVDDLVSLVRALGDARPVLVGASMGGSTSLVAAGEGRVRARALVLVDVAHRIEVEGADRVRAFMAQRPDGFDSLDEVADAIATYQPHRPRPASLDGLAKTLRVTPDGKYRWHWDPRYRAARSSLAERERRLAACARGLTVPTLLVRGARSDVLTDEGAQAFVALCPHASYENVADAAHMVTGDRNDAFGRAIERFLERHAP